MSYQEYTEKCRREVRNWFKDHVAEHFELQGAPVPVHLIRWGKPGTQVFWMEFVFSGGTLHVRGDLGEASYSWHYTMGLQDLATTSLSYFMGKCQASEGGRDWRDWDRDVAKEYFVDHLTERDPEGDELAEFLPAGVDLESCTDEQQNLATEKWAAAKFLELVADFSLGLDSRDEFHDWIRQNDEIVVELFGQDYWEFLYGIGQVPAMLMIAHHEGIKLALAQIAARLEPEKGAAANPKQAVA